MPAVTPAAKARRKAQKREYYLRNRERELARNLQIISLADNIRKGNRYAG